MPRASRAIWWTVYKKILANQMDSLKEELESDYSGGMDKEDGKKTDGAGTGNAEAGGASGSGGLMKDKITINASRARVRGRTGGDL